MRLKLLHYFAALLGIRFKVDGFPYGAVPSHQERSGALSQSPQV
jgi:hypothetical protein